MVGRVEKALRETKNRAGMGRRRGRRVLNGKRSEARMPVKPAAL